MKLPLSGKPLFFVIGVILLLIALAPSLYFYSKYQEAQKILQNPTELTKTENKALIEKVGKIIELPKGEEPEVRTVANKDEVKNQAFFTGAENGDKVLVYSNAKKAFLYRPSLNKIINVAPINVVSPSPSFTPNESAPGGEVGPTPPITPIALISPTPKSQPLRFYLYNGTTTVGLTRTYEATLKKLLPNATVVDRDNAKKNDYTKSILILINESKGKEIEQISKALNLPLEKLPDGEDKPKEAVDFLIILGSDKANL